MLTTGQGLALLRIGVGLFFLSEATAAVLAGWLADAGPLLRRLGDSLQQGNAEAYYRPFLEGVVVPHALLFSQLTTVGELAVAVCLILGLFTRLGALGGAMLVLNYMLMKGLANNAGSIDRLLLLASIVFIVTAAGRVWGLDGLLRDMFTSNPRTRWLTSLAGPAPA